MTKRIKVGDGDIKELQIFLDDGSNVIGTFFIKDGCEYSFGEATLFNEDTMMVDNNGNFFDEETVLKIQTDGITTMMIY